MTMSVLRLGHTCNKNTIMANITVGFLNLYCMSDQPPLSWVADLVVYPVGNNCYVRRLVSTNHHTCSSFVVLFRFCGMSLSCSEFTVLQQSECQDLVCCCLAIGARRLLPHASVIYGNCPQHLCGYCRPRTMYYNIV
jgi:hypothetical protein